MTTTTETSTPAPLPVTVRIACEIAVGEREPDPSAAAHVAAAAHREISARGATKAEWFRMVWRNGEWSYFAEGRMPTGRYLAADRRVTLRGSVYAGDLVAQHDRGAGVDAVYLVSDEPDDGDDWSLHTVPFTATRAGLLITLPTGGVITLPNPRR